MKPGSGMCMCYGVYLWACGATAAFILFLLFALKSNFYSDPVRELRISALAPPAVTAAAAFLVFSPSCPASPSSSQMQQNNTICPSPDCVCVCGDSLMGFFLDCVSCASVSLSCWEVQQQKWCVCPLLMWMCTFALVTVWR